MPVWQASGYGLVIALLPLVGQAIADNVGLRSVRYVVAAALVVGAMVLVSRLPKGPRPKLPWPVRGMFLLGPVVLLSLMSEVSLAGVAPLALGRTLLNAVAIGVGEEGSYRFALHRLWAPYGSTIYVVGSSLLFGLAHVPLGLPMVLATGAIGVVFALARVAGMPLLVLILLHALLDLPNLLSRIPVTP